MTRVEHQDATVLSEGGPRTLDAHGRAADCRAAGRIVRPADRPLIEPLRARAPPDVTSAVTTAPHRRLAAHHRHGSRDPAAPHWSDHGAERGPVGCEKRADRPGPASVRPM